MPISDYPKIQKIINEGYNFRFGSYIDSGFKLVQKNLGMFIGFFLLYILIFAIVGMVPVVGQIVSSLLGPVVLAGFYLVAKKTQNNQHTEFGDFFKGFQFATPIVLRVIATSLIMLICALPFIYLVYDSGLLEWYMELLANPEESQYLIEDFPGLPNWWSMFLLIPLIYFAICYAWADMFIVFKNMSFWDAMEASRQLVSQKWLTIFAFFFVVGLIAMAGALLCGVGMIFTVPAAMCISYIAFADVIKLNDIDQEEDDILDHLVED